MMIVWILMKMTRIAGFLLVGLSLLAISLTSSMAYVSMHLDEAVGVEFTYNIFDYVNFVEIGCIVITIGIGIYLIFHK